MDLEEITKVLNLHGWQAKLKNQGHVVTVGSFWAGTSLRVKRNYGNNCLMISTSTTWQNWLAAFCMGIYLLQFYYEQVNMLVLFALTSPLVNIYQALRDKKQKKLLKDFLQDHGFSCE